MKTPNQTFNASELVGILSLIIDTAILVVLLIK